MSECSDPDAKRLAPGSEHSNIGQSLQLTIALLKFPKTRIVGTSNKVRTVYWSKKDTGAFSSRRPRVPSRPRLDQDVKDDADEPFREIFDLAACEASAGENDRLR